uniref:Interferon-inducible GTPase 5-like n=2 Tax=Podarcis muralis TaxID=64176 RepID=A0A670IQC7_PODMU
MMGGAFHNWGATTEKVHSCAYCSHFTLAGFPLVSGWPMWEQASGLAPAMAGSSVLDESHLKILKAQYEAQNASGAASQIQALVDCVNTLKIQVGILGERGSGVSTLVGALLDKPRRVTDPWAYLREAPETTKQPVVHAHPIYPDLTLHDLPGFEASEKPSAYLKRLGDLSKFSCFVVVVGSGDLRDSHLQVLKAIKQKGKGLILARTKVDLDLHTAERRLRSRYNPSEQLGLIRKELAGVLTKHGMDPKKVFLVSGLETDRYEFARFEDSLEGEVLNLKRTHDGSLEDLNKVSQKKIKELYAICQDGTLSEVPTVISSVLTDPTQIRLDVAVIGVGLTEEDVSHLDLSRYDFFLLVASERYKHTHSCLARAITSAGKQFFFVRSKIDVDVETRPGSQPVAKEEVQSQVRKSCEEALKKDGVDSPQVFLVSCLKPDAFDLPLLLGALSSYAPDLKTKALRKALPTALSRVVRRKAKVLMKDVWGKALQSCLFCVEHPQPDVVDSLTTTIASFCIEFGLDEASLEYTAQATGTARRLLQAVIQSPFAKPLDPAYVLSLITKPTSLTSWAWSYVPYLGRGVKVEPEISFESTYQMLRRAVVELSENAEAVLQLAYTEK